MKTVSLKSISLKKLSFKNSRYGYLFNWHDVNAKGRTVMLLHACLDAIITNLSGGVFYTSFLIMNGIDLVKIGIISFVPFIASSFNIFSPFILERFKKRKLILALSRGLFLTLNVLGVTLMPYLVKDPQAKMVWFLIIIFAANIINAIGGSGYTVWHVHYIPDNVRADYFSITSIITNFVTCGLSMLFSIIADSLSGSPWQNTIIILFRILAFVFAVIDIIVLCAPKEPEYAQSEKNKLQFKNIFVLPIKHTKFLLTMMIIFGYTFFANVPAGQLNFYLLNNVGVDYTYISFINFCWPFFLFVFMPLWKKALRRLGWLKTFAIAQFLHFPTSIAYSFVTGGNYIWLFTSLRMVQHVLGVGRSLTFTNLAYINLPEEDQTNYLSFQLLITNIASFLGMMCGTRFVALTQNSVVNILNFPFTSVQMLLLIQAFGEIIVPLTLLALLKKITPSKASL